MKQTYVTVTLCILTLWRKISADLLGGGVDAGCVQGGSDKNTKMLESQLAELNAKLEQAQRDIQELTSAKSKAQAEATDLGRKLEEAESQLNQLNKAKQTLSKQLEEAKAGVEEESRLKTKLQGENRNLQVRDQRPDLPNILN